MPVYLILVVTIFSRALVLDVRQLQLFAEDRRQLLERDVDLQHVLALALAGLALAVARLRLALADASRPTSPSPWPTPPSREPNLKCGTSMNGTGMEMNSLPFLPIISPCWTYFFRFCLIFPRTICLKRL